MRIDLGWIQGAVQTSAEVLRLAQDDNLVFG